jgi:hypothetical protein
LDVWITLKLPGASFFCMAPLTLEADVQLPPRLHAPSTLDRVYVLIRAKAIADEVRGYLSWAFEGDSSDYVRGWHASGERGTVDAEYLHQLIEEDLRAQLGVLLLMDDVSALHHGFLQPRRARQIVISDQSSRAFRRRTHEHGIDPRRLYHFIRRTEDTEHVSYLEKLWNVIGRPRS